MSTQVSVDIEAVAALAKHRAVTETCMKMADRGVGLAQDQTPEEEGDARDSITAEELDDGGARVKATDWKFKWIEFGTGMRQTRSGANRGEMPTYAPLRKARDALMAGA